MKEKNVKIKKKNIQIRKNYLKNQNFGSFYFFSFFSIFSAFKRTFVRIFSRYCKRLNESCTFEK